VAMAAGLDVRLLGMLLVMTVIWMALNTLTGGNFLTPRNLINLSLQVAVVGIMSCGMVLVIVSRHIDLSVGSQIGFIGVFGALLQNSILPIDAGSTWWIACLAMLGTGLVIGLVQGLLIAFGGVPSFVITLRGLLFFRNAAFYINNGVTIATLNKTFQLLGGGLDGTIGAIWSWVVCAGAVISLTAFVRRSAQRRAMYGMSARSKRTNALLITIWGLGLIGFTATMNAYKQPKSDVSMGIPIPVLILIYRDDLSDAGVVGEPRLCR
jgi:D-xylose transport system permease protein